MAITYPNIISLLTVIALTIGVFILAQLSLILFRVRRIVDRIEMLTDIKSWMSFFQKRRR